MQFDPDALMAALPMRTIRPAANIQARRAPPRPQPIQSALGQPGEYNGFTLIERNRTAKISNRLGELGATERATTCDICRKPAVDEHAENYYDLSGWIGLCRRCHRNLLDKRFSNPAMWSALLDAHQLPDGHWARLVSPEPFDLAQLLRSRGVREPTLHDYAADVASSES